MGSPLTSAFGLLGILAAVLVQSPPQRTPTVDEVVPRMSHYAMAYGAQATMFVGVERYAQRFESERGNVYAPRQLISEFAIIKAEKGNDWIGYRDVVQVDEKPVADRRDRLLRLLTSTTVDAARLKDIANESARFNVGPISRNFNVPTTVLFFFLPSTIERFSFERKGTKDLDGVVTWELEFKETARPTLIRTRDDRDVPASGRVWVTPTDGAVVRTRLELRGFADQYRDRDAPQINSGPRQPNRPSMPQESDERRLESRAVVEVSYRFDRTLGASLPLRMSETYEGPMRSEGMPTFLARATGVAEYSGFKRFETSARIVIPKLRCSFKDRRVARAEGGVVLRPIQGCDLCEPGWSCAE
jgi:hypothetical protein